MKNEILKIFFYIFIEIFFFLLLAENIKNKIYDI